MRVSLTDLFCAGAKATGSAQVDYFDEGTPGLALRVTANGRKAWSFVFTSPKDGKRARLTLGRYPQTTLAQARTLALEAKAHLDGRKDPRDVLAERDAGAMTVAALVPLYLEKPHRKSGRARKSVNEIKRRLEVNVTPLIGAVKLADLHRRDANRVIAAILKRKRPTEAARVFEDFRGMIRWAVGQGYLDRNPMEGMEAPAKAAARERILTAGEIHTLWKGLPTSLARSKACQRIIKLCLVTAQRVGEVAGIEPRELDLRQATWTISASRTKNSFEHVVPLSALAIDLIEEALAAAGCDAKFLFPNPDGDGSLPAAAVARTITRAHQSTEAQPHGRFGIAHWTAHDLRRTAVSIMAEMGVAPIVLGHIINHRSVTKAGVTLAVYSHYDYAKEKRAALELLADRLSAIAKTAPPTVILPIRREMGSTKQ
jgi:integrase